ncbi:MAG: acyl-CoA/acyl-ACP dehydrogenase, partial [Proteobacteria bacterium]|nr:acyl-CoA/acyl-ACP dehydrogenase [Pseudomonadota bacterium]
MPLFLNDEQSMLRDTAKDFVGESAPVSHMRKLRDDKDATGFSRDLWKQFAEMGFTGILIGEDQGGLGLGHVEAGVVLEEIGRNLSPSPFLSTAVAAVEALKGTGHAERWYPGILKGETVAALAIDEGAKHRSSVGLKAERAGNGFRLSGRKQFVTHGHVADLLIVAARTAGAADDEAGVTLFAVPQGAAKMSVTPERLADSSLAARIEFDGVEVDADAVIGEVDGGRGPLARLL